MNQRTWWAGVFLAATLPAVWILFPAAARPLPPPEARPTSAGIPEFHVAGTASCAGRSCHGGLEAAHKPIQQNEFTSWSAADKHGRAYAVLLEPRAQRMARNLAATNPDGKIIAPSLDVRCLACHVTHELAAEASPLHADGVGCEGCHGPAQGDNGWLALHTTAAWKALRPEEKAKHGMTPLDDLAIQARTCAGCHVGAPAEAGLPARDLNHDLMAAGHPRLTFELGSFRVNEPPHWKFDKDAGKPGYEAKVWASGQVAAAQAAVRLLGDRAARAEHGAPWPEFAEADCFSCHSDLRSNKQSWRSKVVHYQGRTPGAAPYSTWYSALLPALNGVKPEAAAAADRHFKELARTMNGSAAEPKDVVKLCYELQVHLDALQGDVAAADYGPATLQNLKKALAALADQPHRSWDEATQLSLAAAALRAADAGAMKQPGQLALDRLWRALAFPPSYESPRDFRRSDSEAIDADLKQLFVP
jgi:hypothetical protein